MLCVSASAFAAAPNMQAGLWEITTNMEMPGMPMQIPPRTIRHCYKAEDLKDTKDALPTDKNCKLDDLRQSGNTAHWKVSCKTESGPMVGVLASLVSPLAVAGISVFAVSTFDTDYLLVKNAEWEWARDVLVRWGAQFEFSRPQR